MRQPRGYGHSFELLQYVYDLSLWSTLGSRRNLRLGKGVSMRMRMKGESYTPAYWQEVHRALIDLVRQLGPPKLFWTVSPYEYLAPYHEWVRDEMAKSMSARMHLPAAETLHLVHCIHEIVEGAIAGANRRNSRGTSKEAAAWTRHLLSAKDGSGERVEVTAFTRIEFQDGSRKKGRFRYKGSGRPHAHVLFFAEGLGRAKLEELVSARLPPDEDSAIRGKAACSQWDDEGDSRWPVYAGPEGWDEDEAVLRLRHGREDEDDGERRGVHRAYFVDVMDAFPYHQDLQVSDGEAMLLEYVAKYCSKFSDGAFEEWLSAGPSRGGTWPDAGRERSARR